MVSPYPKTWVLVFDGAKRILFEDIGFADAPHLKLRADSEIELPPDRALSDDKPGRYPTPAGGRSSVETIDKHEQLEGRFVRQTAALIDARAAADAFERLVIIAPAKALAAFKESLKEARAKVVAERQGDFVNAPTTDIERAYLSALAQAHVH